MNRLIAAILLSLVPFLNGICGGSFGFDPETEWEKAASVYLAPENQLIFKVVFPNGEFRQFERDYSVPGGGLRSDGGWTARFLDQGRVSVKSPQMDGGRLRLTFLRGRLVEMRYKGVTHEFDANAPRNPPENVYPPLAISRSDDDAAARRYAEESFLHKWDGTGRLQFPFVNPNQCGVLYAEIFLLAVFAFLCVHGGLLRGSCAGLAVAAAVCLFWTMSRGAWLGAALGLLICFWGRFWGLFKRRSFWILVCVGLASVGLWVACNGAGQISRGFDGSGGNWTNAIRLEILRNSPRMMFDAPGGWDFCSSGVAYLNWYQPLTVFALTPTLINDHLTRLVAWGWTGRFLYLLGWSLLLSFCCWQWIRNRLWLPLGMWLVLLVAGCFNPVMHVRVLWIAPLVASVPLLLRLPQCKRRQLVCILLTSVISAGILTAGLFAWGCKSAARAVAPSVRAEGNRIMLNGCHPRIWIVDDGTIGGGLTGKDIREFYESVPHAPAIGYVSSIGDLPKGIDLLVLSGHAGSDWLTLLSENESARKSLPHRVVFVSPPFSPSAIPQALFTSCSVKVVAGEFAANYDPDYRTKRSWVEIVPGMERYVLRWMEHVLGE